MTDMFDLSGPADAAPAGEPPVGPAADAAGIMDLEGAENLRDLVVFVDHASGAISSPEAELVEIDHVVR